MNSLLLSISKFVLLMFTLSVVSTSGVFSQTLPVNEESGRIEFKEVVELADVEAKALYHSGLKFYRTNFLIEDLSINDPENYSIVGPMATSFRYLGKNMIVSFNSDLQFRDGRYRFVFDNLKLDTKGGGVVDLDKGFPAGMVGRKKMTENVMVSMSAFVDELKRFIESDSVQEDW